MTKLDLAAHTTRTQLTLFVPEPAASQIERVRRMVDPIQFRLIPAHVTLCREHELDDLDIAALRRRVTQAAASPIVLTFGPPSPFAGHGMLLPCAHGAEAFTRLRAVVLDRPEVDHHEAHLTLAHPRNPRAAGNSAAAYASLPSGMAVEFSTIALIRQAAGQPWVVEATIPLHTSVGLV